MFSNYFCACDDVLEDVKGLDVVMQYCGNCLDVTYWLEDD